MESLGFNIWQRYLGSYDTIISGYNQHIFPRGELPNDKLFANDSSYQQDVIPYYISKANLNNNYLYLNRPKIEMLSFAQRSDYHPFAMSVNESPKYNKYYWWFGYETVDTGTPVQDNGKWVRRWLVGVHNSGYVLKNLRSTWEQVKSGVPNYYYDDAIYSWYIKPSVKINPNVAPNTKIFRVDIYKKNGALKDSIVIIRSDFDFDTSYTGNKYKDVFFPPDYDSLKIFNGAELRSGTNNGDSSFVDYAIYWYGTCDMWLERVRVENDWAVRLFDDYYLKPAQPWIAWEVNGIAKNITRPYKFMLDESEHNMYPAIGYLNHIIDSLKPAGSKLSVISSHNILYHTPALRTGGSAIIPEDVGENIFTQSEMNEINIDMYPLPGSRYASQINLPASYVPNTLPVCNYSIDSGRLADPITPMDYENYFNANLDADGDHSFRYTNFYKRANNLSRKFDKPLIPVIQIHSWYNGNPIEYSLREPTNEEIEALTGIAVTYGAKGIMYFWYSSNGVMGVDNSYGRGLIGNRYDPVGFFTCTESKRYTNAYGQPKWQKIKDLNAKLKKLGKEIIRFDNQQSYGYRYHIQDERNDFLSSSFIDQIVTLRNSNDQNQCEEYDTLDAGLLPDCSDHTYIQAGLFKTSNSDEKFFMLVNRRASPVSSSSTYDGKRIIRIKTKQNASNLSGFNNWNIIDVETDAVKAAFDKTIANNYIYLDTLDPGEMKLYKVLPVMVTGGTLTGNESISNVNINCDSTVYNNGYNITLGTGTTINFADNAGIIMQGGSFTSGTNIETSNPQVILTAKNNVWQGLNLSECPAVYIYNTKFEKPDTAQYLLELTDCYDMKQ
ncbi:MAG: hypothetical protein NTV87_15360 [Ignavibacteriae bacterium]|nr:hypothetical protein [Ignavibacteriota bacterium]